MLGNRFSADFLNFEIYTTNEAHKQYSLLATIFNYILDCGPPGKHLYFSSNKQLHGYVVDILNLCIDVFQEINTQNIFTCDIEYTILLMGFIYDIKSKYSRHSVENLFSNMPA